MAGDLLWSDSEEIAIELFEARPDLDPLTLRFSDLRDMVAALDRFRDDPKRCSEGKLEAIQMAWLEEWKDEHE